MKERTSSPVDMESPLRARQQARILLIEDNGDHALLERRALESLEGGAEVQVLDSPRAGLGLLQERRFDLIIADYRVPEMDGISFLRAVRGQGLEVPVVMVTGLGNERIAVEALKAGAYDYVVKESGYLELLPSVAERALAAFQTRLQLEGARRELAESEERYRELIHDLDAVVWEAEPETFRPTFVSQRAETLLGHPIEAWLAGPDFRLGLIHKDDREAVLETWSLALEDRRCQVAEYRMLAADGDLIWLRDIVRAVDRNGESKTLRGLMVDISAQKQAEQETRLLHRQLLQSQKLESIGTLAGGIAHDFNNLIQGVLGNAVLALEEQGPTTEVQKCLQAIVKSAERARDLTTQLLAFSRPAELRIHPIELNDVVEESMLMLSRLIPSTVEIQFSLDPALQAVEADATQIEQVLVNLCVNSRDAMPDGGKLSITTYNRVLSAEEADVILDASPGPYTVLGVSDSGAGIAPDDLPRIFDPFFTTKGVGKGTGLGLAAAYGVIKSHGGWIQVQSRLGQGSNFEVYLPATDKAVCRKARPSLPSGEGTETVLVVDDEPVVRELACKILRHYGYKTYQASNGSEAIRVYSERSSEIDLVLLDLTMPRLNGIECARRLKSVSPHLPLIISSGYNSMANDELDPQIATFVPKPYRPEELATTIRSVLDSAGAALH